MKAEGSRRFFLMCFRSFYKFSFGEFVWGCSKGF